MDELEEAADLVDRASKDTVEEMERKGLKAGVVLKKLSIAQIL